MTKILIAGDVHLKARRLAETAEAWERVVRTAIDEGASHILQAGDVFDHANVFGKEATVGTIYDAFLAPLRGGEVKVLLISGNHDIAGPKDKDALAPVEGHSWATVLRQPGSHVLEEGDGGGITVVAVPWVSRAVLFARMTSAGMNPDEAKEKIEEGISDIFRVLAGQVAEAKEKGHLVIFMGHMEVTGALWDNGEVQADGAFEFSPAGMGALGADAYAIGHIHKRQPIPGLPNPHDGYLGSICQNTYGESHVPATRLIEVADDWTIASDRLIPNKHSPRYYAVDEEGLEELDYREGIDHVELRGDEKPADLPPGVTFKRNPSRAARKVDGRATSLDAGSSLKDLLGAWAAQSGCELAVDDLLAAATEISAPPSMSSVGSLDRIDRILLRGVTCHEDTELDLSGMTGVVAVEGANGAGKTSAMEAPLLAWYGETPSRSVADLIPIGRKKACLLEVDFTSQGQSFVARREFKRGKKSISHKAFLYEEGNKEPVAGPGVKETRKECSVKVGDMDLVLASVFSSQGDAGSLVDVEPADRKDLFAGLMGTDKFIKMAEDARSRARGESAKAEAIEARVSDLRRDLGSEEDDAAKLDSLRGEREQAEEDLEEVLAAVEKAKEALDEARESNARRGPMATQLAELKERKSTVHARGVDSKKKKAELEATLRDDAEERLAAARKARDELDAAGKKRTAAIEKKSAMDAEAAGKESEASSVREARARAYSEEVKESQKKATALRAEREGKRVRIDDKIQALRDQASSARAELAMMRKTASSLEGFPDEEPCRECLLAKDGIEARDGAEGKQEEVDVLDGRIKTGESKLAGFVAKTDEMADEAGRVPPEDEFMAEERLRADALDAEAGKIKEQAAKLAPPPPGEDEEKRALADSIEDVEEEIAGMAGARAEIASLDTLLSELRSEHEELKGRVATLEGEIPEERDEAGAKATLRGAEKTAEGTRARLDGLATNIGRQEAVVKQNEKNRRELDEQSDKGAEASRKAGLLSALAAAFGRDGIPQMLVENALPRFQDVMNELMGELEGTWSIRVASQKTTGSGTTKEVIDIPVDDGDGEREIGTYSGGEKKLLKHVVRIAFAALQAERHGKGLKVLILDEALDALDDERAGVFVQIIDRLTRYFNQIFIVSHNVRILSSIPAKIQFSREPGRPSKVVVAAMST
jgi:exonuclease SbcC